MPDPAIVLRAGAMVSWALGRDTFPPPSGIFSRAPAKADGRISSPWSRQSRAAAGLDSKATAAAATIKARMIFPLSTSCGCSARKQAKLRREFERKVRDAPSADAC
jgi:hypothetical protein